MTDGAKRGLKREREDSMVAHPGAGALNGTNQIPISVTPVNGVPSTTGAVVKPHLVVGAKAGNAGVRPRPLKKPRMV